MTANQIQDHAGTLERGLAVLHHVGLHEDISTNAIAREVGLSRSTAYRTVGTLRRLGYLESDRDTGRVRLGPRSLELAVHALAGADLHSSAPPVMRALARQAAETVYLGVPDEDGMVFVARQDGPNQVVLRHQPGARLPMHATSTGKAWLAALSRGERAARVAGMRLTRMTPGTIADPDRLLTELDRTDRRGWAIDNVECEPEVGGVAAAVLDRSGRPVAALGIAGPAGRVLLRLDLLGPAVRAAADALSLRLGHLPNAVTG